jgi:hypothetical protein
MVAVDHWKFNVVVEEVIVIRFDDVSAHGVTDVRKWWDERGRQGIGKF